MRLAELKPHWVEKDGRRVCVVFLCLKCVQLGKARPEVLSCFIVPMGEAFPSIDEEYEFFDELLPRLYGEGYGRHEFVGCKREIAWSVVDNNFELESLTLRPSLNHYHWHGHVTAGAIDGGL